MITLIENPLEQVNSYKHIDVNRQETMNKTNHLNSISLRRRTLYSLMGAEMHGYNGINPTISIKMWNMFEKPKTLYGFESPKLTL